MHPFDKIKTWDIVIMKFFNGIACNLKGLKLGIRTPKLLALGLIRFAVVILFTVAFAFFILAYYQEILSLIWVRPESLWVLWLWHLLSWLLSLLLVGLSSLLAYIVAQIFFGVFIMDTMSRITEQIVTGGVKQPEKMPVLKLFIFLIKQEIPRAIIPILITFMIMALGWLTPLGPILAILASVVAVIFLAWDNTDLRPARQLESFKNRFKFLLKNLLFHIGFGLWFLIPVLNIIFISFAPVGGTLFHLDTEDSKHKE